jgi:protoporphyrinogen/coproporphyrinogen III oxidase
LNVSSADSSKAPVVVVGGGIAGLAAAWELTGGEHRDPDAPRVVLLEAARRLGGALHSESFDGTVVDVGPDGFLGRRPEAAALCREVGLGDQLTPIGAAGASVYTRGHLRALPAGLMVGVPTRWWPVARSGILGPLGSARLLRDAVLPRTDRRGPLGDRALGPLVARRQGQRVVDALVDPLIGGIHAGSVADMSTAAVMPQLLTVPRRGGLMRALRRIARNSPPVDPDDAPPAFWALRHGMRSLIERLEAELVGRGVDVRTEVAVTALGREPDAWILGTPVGPLRGRGVVLAVPAGAAGSLLGPHDSNLAGLEHTIDYGSVTVITMAFRGELTLPSGTGFLVPRRTPSPLDGHEGEELLLTAGTFLDVKWPHLARPGRVLLRVSVGRFGDRRAEQMDDRELTGRVANELGAVLGSDERPTDSLVTRWPQAFPQYRVGHLLRVSGIEAAVKRLPALAVAGAPYRGVGIPACVASGREAARSVLESLVGPPPS